MMPGKNDSVPADTEMNAGMHSERVGWSGVGAEGRFFPFFLKALGWGGVVYFISGQFAVNSFWVVVLSVLLFSVPIAVSGIYGNTVNQIRRLAIFAEKGWIYNFFSGRPLKIAFWTLWALVTSFLMLLQFQSCSKIEWYAFFLIVPVFWSVFRISRRLVARELKPYLVTSISLTLARRISPLVMIIVYLVLVVYFERPPEYHSIQEAVDAGRVAVSDMTGSALVREFLQLSAFWEGVKGFALGRIGSVDATWALALFAAGGFVIFYNACAMLTCFLIPGSEYRRIFGPLTTADSPPPLPPSRIGFIAAVLTFVILFIYLPLFVYMEGWARHAPRVAESRKSAESWIIPRLERIDDAFFREGTFAQLQDARMEAVGSVDALLAGLEVQADRAFDRMEANVDDYLDWYYSLVGEYARIANMLVGELENYMIKKFEESMLNGDSFGQFQSELDRVLAEYELVRDRCLRAARRIMAENRVEGVIFPVEVVRQISLEDAISPPVHDDVVGLKHRLAAGAGGGAVAGAFTAVVSKKIIGKVAGKGIFKFAAKALTKIVVGKTAGSATGAGAGAAGGAAVGSIVPVVGTTAGAIVGGIVGGIIVGVTVDKMLIELEEAINREEFKKEILSGVREARSEFKARLQGRQASFDSGLPTQGY